MNDYELKTLEDLFARLFVIAIKNKINFNSFTNMLERSVFIYKIEENKYDDYFNASIERIFNDITGFSISVDCSYGIYNDAYWCGKSYFDLHYKLNKSFAYLFLKLPLEKLMDCYLVYHEMDFSSLVDFFNKTEKEKTILRLLCINNHCSLNDISKKTLIGISTLKKYNASDEALYNGTFQNIIKLICYFKVPYHLFIK